MLGLLLARAGIDVVVLEKHADFLRDFRGDTIHPSTLEILDELGLADRFLELPYSRVTTVVGSTTSEQTIGVSFAALPTRFRFVAFVPQWDFLRFVTEEATRYPTFRLLMEAEVTGLIEEAGYIRGLRYRTRSGDHEMRALVTVGADGRRSITRDTAGLRRIESAPPMDVLWFRVSRRPEDAAAVALRFGDGHAAGLIDRGDYWQIGYIIPKGDADRIRTRGLEAFRQRAQELLPNLSDRFSELHSWDDIKLLTVQADRLAQWFRPGYLAIGDAAHAMSPIGGVGINLAIQDAVCAANVLWKPLRAGRVSSRDLARVQWRREFPVRVTQAIQGIVQRFVLQRVLAARGAPSIPWIIRFLLQTPGIRRLPPRVIALGIARPHVGSPLLTAPADGHGGSASRPAV
ncbi:MAG: FAD-dependent oxidoreductase [Gemmatimonadaceae bacterium]